MFVEKRFQDGGRRCEDHPLLGMLVMAVYGMALGCIVGFIVGRASL